jgi:four helix bundle protein
MFSRDLVLKDVGTHPFHDRCLEFSLAVLRLVHQVRGNSTLRPIADQLLRSGTSVGANTQEARSAESTADFIHKIQIALKECREAGYWLTLIYKSNLIEDPSLPALCKECNEITAMLVSSVKTSKNKQSTALTISE